MASSGAGGGRRYPQNLQGILRFCTENTQVEDAPASGGTTHLTQMSDERRQWLNEALKSLTDNDPIKVMLEDIKVLTSGDESDERKEAALEDLEAYSEDIDLAKDFHKIGGFSLLTSLLHSEQEGIRWRSAGLIAVLVQNNPYCQREALNANFLTLLLNVLDTDSSPQVRIKALYAVSCMTRDVPEAQEKFLALDGFSVLMRAMQGEEEKLQTKAAFMLGAMCTSQPKFKDILCDMGMVEQLIGLLQGEHMNFHEHVLSALRCLASDHPRCMTECQRPELSLKTLLEERIKLLQGKEENEEELEHGKELLSQCFSSQASASSVDR